MAEALFLNGVVMEETLDEKNHISPTKFYVSAFAGLIILIIFDMITKFLAETYLMDTEGISLIDGVLRLYYLENTGAAFGIFKNMQPFFIVLTLVFLAIAVSLLLKIPKTRRYFPMCTALIFLMAGAIGNFIDRITKAYVVDFIYFEIIDFPVFNVADIYVTLSVIAIVLLLLFYYKDGEFYFLSKKHKSGAEDERA